jgi:hypothetical protein
MRALGSAAPTTGNAAPVASSSVTRALWETVDAKWDEPSAHEAFLAACAEEGLLAFAAQKYREQKAEQREDRGEVSEVQLQKVTALALAQLAAVKTPPPQPKRLITVLSVLVSLALIVACAYLMTL